MKLYHFCRASDLDSIAEKGLYPHVPTEPVMSLGEEVVWLTTQKPRPRPKRTSSTIDGSVYGPKRRSTKHSAWLAAGHRQDASPHSSCSIWAEASELWRLAAREWRRGDHQRKRDGTGQR